MLCVLTFLKVITLSQTIEIDMNIVELSKEYFLRGLKKLRNSEWAVQAQDLANIQKKFTKSKNCG